MPDDYYVSQYSGEEIDALLGSASKGVVRYDAAQTLTDAQKQQARKNIAAAPDGYGLGGHAVSPPNNSIDDAKETGLYLCGPGYIGAPSGHTYIVYGTVLSMKRADNSVIQVYWSEASSNISGSPLNLVRRFDGTKWYPWEWVNPPMVSGIEYRTTERYAGKPVYVQLVNFGALGNATTKSVDVAIENVDKIPVLGGTALEVPLIPGSYNGAISGISATRTSAKITISITTTADLSWMQAEVLLGYTKTTD